MNSQKKQTQTGFSMLEIIMVIAIIALIAAVSVPIYQNYNRRAQATEIVLLFDELRTGMRSELQGGEIPGCDELQMSMGTPDQIPGYDVNVGLSFDVVPGVPGGYKPVMVVGANTGQHGADGLAIARAAYQQLNEVGVVNRAIDTSSLISFTSKLSDTAGADCTRAVSTNPRPFARPGSSQPTQTQ